MSPLPPRGWGYKGHGNTENPQPPTGGAGVAHAGTQAAEQGVEGVSDAPPPGMPAHDAPGRTRLRLANRLAEVEQERDHWEAEHAALFSATMGEGAGVRIAKAFGGYDDFAWQKLEGFERWWLIGKGNRVVEMFREAVGEL